MNPDLTDASPRLQPRQTRRDVLAHLGLDVGPLLDDAGFKGKVEVGGVLVVRVDPAVSNEQPPELGRYSRRCEDRGRNVRNVLAWATEGKLV
jgi:hypothetical protein